MLYNINIEKVNISRRGSVDIDALNRIEPEIQQCLEIASVKMNEDPHWLNNAWYHNRDYNDELFPISEFFVDNSLGLNNINLYVADLKTILIFKARAIDNRVANGLRERQQDVEDVEGILEWWGLSEEDFLNKMRYSHIEERYPYFIEWAQRYFYKSIN